MKKKRLQYLEGKNRFAYMVHLQKLFDLLLKDWESEQARRRAEVKLKTIKRLNVIALIVEPFSIKSFCLKHINLTTGKTGLIAKEVKGWKRGKIGITS